MLDLLFINLALRFLRIYREERLHDWSIAIHAFYGSFTIEPPPRGVTFIDKIN